MGTCRWKYLRSLTTLQAVCSTSVATLVLSSENENMDYYLYIYCLVCMKQVIRILCSPSCISVAVMAFFIARRHIARHLFCLAKLYIYGCVLVYFQKSKNNIKLRHLKRWCCDVDSTPGLSTAQEPEPRKNNIVFCCELSSDICGFMIAFLLSATVALLSWLVMTFLVNSSFHDKQRSLVLPLVCNPMASILLKK